MSLITRAVGEWLLSRDTLVRDGGDLLPGVLQHATLQMNMLRLLSALGLQRREPRAMDLPTYIAARARERAQSG